MSGPLPIDNVSLTWLNLPDTPGSPAQSRLEIIDGISLVKDTVVAGRSNGCSFRFGTNLAIAANSGTIAMDFGLPAFASRYDDDNYIDVANDRIIITKNYRTYIHIWLSYFKSNEDSWSFGVPVTFNTKINGTLLPFFNIFDSRPAGRDINSVQEYISLPPSDRIAGDYFEMSYANNHAIGITLADVVFSFDFLE